jgi:hypothetical protein
MKARLAMMLFVVATVASFYTARSVTAGEIDLVALMQETQRMSQKSGEITLAWWLPEEYWKASLAQQKQLSADQAESFLKVMRPYIVVIVVKGKISLSSTFESEEFARKNTKVLDAQGNAYSPLAEADLDATAKAVLGMFKPMLANTMGAMGHNMHVLVFPAKTADGRQIVDTTQKGQFKVTLADKEFKWRLPFDSALPKQSCPECKEDCKGSWIFCPWCGTKLKK